MVIQKTAEENTDHNEDDDAKDLSNALCLNSNKGVFPGVRFWCCCGSSEKEVHAFGRTDRRP